MLKDGAKHLSGLEETVLKNIEACKQLSKMTRTSLGPNGMNKMVINHLDKLFVTSDAATIVKELEVAHPAARLLVMAAQAQEQEIGDGTNMVRGAVSQRSGSLPSTGQPPSLAVSILTAKMFLPRACRQCAHAADCLAGHLSRGRAAEPSRGAHS